MSVKRNNPCPCGSGKRYKKCCADDETPASPVEEISFLVLKNQLEKAMEVFASIKPNNNEVTSLVRLANWLKDKEKSTEAEICYRKSLEINPDNPEANNNLGIILKKNRNYSEALEKFNKTVSIDPDSAIALYNLGIVFRKIGNCYQAEICFKKALRISPDYVEAHFNLGIVLRDQEKISEAETSFSRVLHLRPDYPKARIELAILSWVDGRSKLCDEHLKAIASTSTGLSDKDKKIVIPYKNFLYRLVEYRNANADKYEKCEEKAILYSLGDSHSLSLANTTVEFQGIHYFVKTKTVSGCKAWHLGNANENEYKASFLNRVNSIPSGSIVIALFGEIDCRLDEGLIRHYGKTENLKEPTNDLVRHYVDYIYKIFKEKNLLPILCNIPAPLIGQDTGRTYDISLLSDLIKYFNETLYSAAVKRNIPILDVYSFSKNDKGLANKTCHIDRCHLLPEVYIKLLNTI